jgi:hypothetical protein
MRAAILSLSVLLAACAGSQIAAESIEVVYSETMYYTIEDGGRARIVGADTQRVLEFDASRQDFRRVADLLAPLQAEGLACVSSSEHIRPGYIVWRRAAEETRRVELHISCYEGGVPRPLAENVRRAWRAMAEMGRARDLAPAIPDPTIISVEWMYWGNPTSSWSVSRSGEGRYSEGDRTQTFAVSAAQFDEIRDIFRPYENRWFECDRVIADGPYGDIVWSSREGREDQRTRFDAGCVRGDAADLFERLGRAEAMVNALRGAVPAH